MRTAAWHAKPLRGDEDRGSSGLSVPGAGWEGPEEPHCPLTHEGRCAHSAQQFGLRGHWPLHGVMTAVAEGGGSAML